jgi:hypothetical protein
MHLDKYKDEDGYYFPIPDMPQEKGCFYEDVESLIQIEILGFCGCGCPDESVKYVGKALRLIQDRADTWDNRTSMPFEEWKAKCKELFKTSEAEYFMFYYLDSKDLTEHGGSVPGWLTDKGRELMEDIEEIYKEESQ